MKKPLIYLDHAAATPVADEVLQVMLPYFSSLFYNPSAGYTAAHKVKKDLEAARHSVAHILGARPNEIIFTAGGTEANNLAIHGIMSQYPDGNVVLGAIEHESVLLPAKKYESRQAPVSSEGIVKVDRLMQLIDDQTVLVSVMYANNEVGSVQPIRDIARRLTAIREKRRQSGNNRPLLLHTDAAQAANYLDVHVSRLGVDMMTLNGGKIYGPKASGALFVASHVRLQPVIVGGGQERGMRSGTENVPASIGFARALELAQGMRKAETARLQDLQQLFIGTLQQALPHVNINGSLKHRLPNNIHVTIAGNDNERLLYALDELGIMVAVGSACSANNEEPSHVLRAMSMSDADAQSSLRFTMGRNTSEKEVRHVCEILHSVSR